MLPLVKQFSRTNRLITDSRRLHISNQLNDCTDSHQRWRVVCELLHSAKGKLVRSLADNDALCVSYSTLYCNKISSLKSVITSQIASLSSPPSDPICNHLTMLFLKPVTASEVFKILSIPSKTSVLDFVPTSVLKSCPALFSDLIAHLANL